MSYSKANKFENLITDSFSFLETLGFKKKPLQQIDFENLKDSKVEISYASDNRVIVVRWFLLYAKMEVIVIATHKGKIPEKYSIYGGDNCDKAINVYDLAEYMLTHKLDSDATQTSSKLANNTDMIKKFSKKAEKDFLKYAPYLISNYATILAQFIDLISTTDIDIFREIQEYSKNKSRIL